MNTRSVLYITCVILFVFKAYCNDLSSVKRGEGLFIDYCSGCHTLRYMSYHKVSMPEEEANLWFGRMPPDLSLIARERGTHWLVDFLRGFYPDSRQPYGSNNDLLPNVMMPNALAPLQYESNEKHVCNKDNFNQAVSDVVVFLNYVSDPNAHTRHITGYIVIGFLCVLLLLVKVLVHF